MKALFIKNNLPLTFILIIFLMLSGCSEGANAIDELSDPPITSLSDKEALLFMLEEEKLARDTYDFLGSYWTMQQFAKIKQSEQSHMDAVENLLIEYDIAYTILPAGKFNNTELQNLYDQFVVSGKESEASALHIGATIEDLDIVDLQERIQATENNVIIGIFQSLQCGSGNHLRAFVGSLESIGVDYSPQFLSVSEYETIINSNSGSCR